MIVVRHNYISARDRQSRRSGKPPKLAAVGRALAHVKYIQHRPGEDRQDGGRDMFDDQDDNLDGKDLRKAIRENRDSKVVVHKITLAPEINPEDKKAFTREVMKKLGRDKGLDLHWVGVEHDNTDHNHIHVVVMGKDKTGKDVRFDKKDYDRIKDYCDRYLERVHPFELEKSRSDREERERERLAARNREREAARQERIRDGLELPWMHKKIIREKLEPYDQWKQKQKDIERGKVPAEDRSQLGRDPGETEKPYFHDTIEAAGREWSKRNTLKELQELNQHLWDNPDERIEKPEYKKLIAWMKEKEELAARAPRAAKDKADKEPGAAPDKQKDSFDYQGTKYSKDSSYEQLSALSNKLRDKKAERLPVDEYQKLRGWLENADRARWANVLERELAATHKKFERSKTMEDHKSAEGGRVLNPMQEQMMSNPVVGLFMQGAGLANTLVRWIPLTDNRDRVKEAGDAMEEAKRDKHDEYVKPGRDPEHREKDKEVIDKLDKAIEENKRTQDEQKKKKKEKEQEKKDKNNPFSRDPWGRW